MMESSSFQPNVRRTTTKMASMTAVSVFLLCCFAVASVASQDCDQFAATGRSFNVPLGYVLKKTETLKWKFNDKTVFYQKTTGVITGGKDNITADGSLKRINVSKNQEGLYTAEVFDEQGKEKTKKTIQLCVLDPVIKPKVETACKDKNVIIKCTPDKPPKDVEYRWIKNGVEMEKETKLSFEVNAAQTKADKFACKFFNKASSEVSDAVTHDCAKTGIPGLPDELWGISIWYYVGGGGGIVLLLIIIVIVCCLQTRRTRKLRLKDEEELRLEWTNTEQHNHHHHHHHDLPPLPNHPPPHHPHNHQHQQQQQQAPGNTGPRQSRSKQNRQPRPKAPEPNSQPQPSPRRALQAKQHANDADEEQPPPLPQPRKKGPKTQLD
ncbi:T-cell surface antigen CD2 isoform X2 [Fundulus heteroclitus]|uniref:T-cell surface antigen CD2 isoform X2 n=1 Tax=Fundulus heteroclitus TaxID=8078 RepID=UPI00165CBF02|nr:T-cell surface antigen CD2 isoform X2 [Fundulus heteroclitus]